MRFTRASGILLHPTSLPGPYGIGDLGGNAYEFVDWLVSAGQKLWQILPLGPTSYGNSPYSSYSAFAGNTLLISPELLVKDGLVRPKMLGIAPVFAADRVDYGGVNEWKQSLLNEAFETFKAASNSPLTEEFAFFRRENAWWLDDYAAFRAIKNVHDHSPWSEWAQPIRLRKLDALDQTRSQLAREIEAERFFQYVFFRQWLALKNYANSSGVQIIGDLPIFVAYDSADVWCNQSKFKLNPDGSPTVVSGVPPDYFSKTGQLWGNPIYDWQAMLADNFNWWTARIAFSLKLNDIIRLDHFIGFLRNWEIPGEDETAENGVWASVPGRELFTILRQRLGELPIIAEDLGSMTTEVEELRDTFGFAGMRILQYAFGGDAYNRDLPHNYNQNTVAYTGTHDNDTTAGWYKSAPKNVKTHCRKYLRTGGREMHWEMIRACLASTANTAIIPAQDVLGLGSESRMNTPATAGGNWEWRLIKDELNEQTAGRLRDIAAMFGRV
ncbi:MAG: 4-alpha-glucanotransferase [Acidobacteria bacterium]|nr:4-alpha-glucanotransferase [Acidobacteriota bacterium]